MTGRHQARRLARLDRPSDIELARRDRRAAGYIFESGRRRRKRAWARVRLAALVVLLLLGGGCCAVML